MVPNTGSQAKGWWYYSQLSFADVGKKLSANKARLIDLDPYYKGGKLYYNAVMIANKGKDQKAWWYYSNITASDLKNKLAQNKARITDIEIRSTSSKGTRFAVIMERLSGETWWWYYGKTMKQVNELTDQNGARIIDITPYKNAKGQKRFAVVMLRNVNAQTNRLRSYLANNRTGGSYGLYVKQVGGGVKAALQEDCDLLSSQYNQGVGACTCTPSGRIGQNQSGGEGNQV